jgi:hypothetical protein
MEKDQTGLCEISAVETSHKLSKDFNGRHGKHGLNGERSGPTSSESTFFNARAAV